MKRSFFVFILVFSFSGVFGRTVKNVIFIVPDGTSLETLSLTRMFLQYTDSSKTGLTLDPYFCGFVRNHSTNAPVGDSAPTMGWYMTGYPSQTGFVAMSPPQDVNDLVYVNPLWAYSPRMTIAEGARIAKNKAVGIVVTCEVYQATPANLFAHWHKRSNYRIILQQMVHSSIDVVIGGGTGLLTKEQETFLREKGVHVCRDDLQSFRNSRSGKLWALFGDKYMSNEWDRDTTAQPSLAEMTRKAISLLSENDEGFLLLVEGSKIDWMSHRNDPVGIISEVSALDEAFAVAIEFARNDGQTLVVVCPDHGTGGVSIGNSLSDKGYDRLPIDSIMGPLARCTRTSEYITEQLIALPKYSVSAVIYQYWAILPDSIEIDSVFSGVEAYNRSGGNQTVKDELTNVIAGVLKSRTYIGFTTHGHTGEDVFLAVYDPRADMRVTGYLTARDINWYMCDAVGIGSLDELTDRYYCKATDLFGGEGFQLKSSDETLTIGFGADTLFVHAYTNQVLKNGQVFETQTPAVYVDTTNTWFVSRECLEILSSNYSRHSRAGGNPLHLVIPAQAGIPLLLIN